MEFIPLNHGAKVQGTNYTYTIDQVLSKGAYGITYLATVQVVLKGELGEISADAKVTLKEFYMPSCMARHGEVVERDFSDKQIESYARCFYLEPDNISALSHPNIIKVLEVFVANNTCYYAMEFLSGGSLYDLVQKKGALAEEEAITYIIQIGSALSYMHLKKITHMDIKPKNIMFDSDGKAKIIDYGLAHRYDSDGELELSDGLGCGTPGYSPIEQSEETAVRVFSPTLDVYSLAATYYKMLTGRKPASAQIILNNGLDTVPLVDAHVSQQSIDAIKAGMEPRPCQRLQSVDDFISMLPNRHGQQHQVSMRDKKNWCMIATIIIIIVCLCVLIIYGVFFFQK